MQVCSYGDKVLFVLQEARFLLPTSGVSTPSIDMMMLCVPNKHLDRLNRVCL